MPSVRIGAGSGFWGDALDPAVELVERGDIRYLGLDFLAELTMALLQRQRSHDETMGYVGDLVPYLRALLPSARKAGVTIVTNAGGVNPAGAALAAREMAAQEEDLVGLKIAVVEGDDLLPRLDELLDAGIAMPNTDTGETDLAAIRDRIVAANAYTGAEGIVEALGGGADVVITGRVSDSALYVGPLMHEFGWTYDDSFHDRVGAAITLGHLVECAAGVTGGMSSQWNEMPRMGEVGFPFFEIYEDGSALLTKVPGTGGRVDQWTVKEHLTYETIDPANYLAPDGIADFTALHLEEVGEDRVRITGMRGRRRPDQLKLIIGYEDGWIGEGLLFFPWPDAYGRAQKARETLLERFDRLALNAEDVHFDFVGVNMLHGPAAPEPSTELGEVGLRVAVKARTRAEAEKVRRACSQLWILGPGGTSFGAPLKPRPVISAWPTLIPRGVVRQSVKMLTVERAPSFAK